jgi:hypothetical protein
MLLKYSIIIAKKQNVKTVVMSYYINSDFQLFDSFLNLMIYTVDTATFLVKTGILHRLAILSLLLLKAMTIALMNFVAYVVNKLSHMHQLYALILH